MLILEGGGGRSLCKSVHFPIKLPPVRRGVEQSSFESLGLHAGLAAMQPSGVPELCD